MPPSGRILIVDDSETHRALLARRLEQQGWDVEESAGGTRAVERLDGEPWDLVLLDIQMPDVDGMETLRRIRARFSPSALPVVMVSSQEGTDDIVEALRLGANDYIPKSLDLPVVLARVRTQILLKQAHDELERRRAFIERIFGRYVSDEVVRNLLDHPEGLELRGTRRRITILMADLRGFSATSESLAPEIVLTTLNLIFGRLIEIVTEYGGTIDELLGDALLVFFGAPLPMDDHEEKAIRCGLALQREMRSVLLELRRRGLPELELGIAINTGEVVVGNVGSMTRAKYGAVGSEVNFTSRIEGFSVGGQVLVSEKTAARLEGMLEIHRSYGVRAKGYRRPFQILDIAGFVDEPELSVPRPEGEESALEVPLDVTISRLAGKCLENTRTPARVVGIAPRALRLKVGDVPLESLMELRVAFASDLAPDEAPRAFGRVLEVDDENGHWVRLTWVEPEAQRLLDEYRTRASR